MSKSKGNVIAPDEYVAELGADAVRCYLMFVGPWEFGGEWSDSGIVGISRWLNRVWSLVTTDYVSLEVESKVERELRRIVHKTIRKATEDLEKFRFNTMIASLMELTNYLSKVQEVRNVSLPLWQEAISYFLLLLAPTAPHLAEELWVRSGHSYSIHNQSWPKFDQELAKETEITLPIEVNGKLRDKLVVSASITEVEARELALSRERVKAYTNGKKIDRIIYIPGRVMNIVVR
jgi:leucyl-tRNA synthetase